MTIFPVWQALLGESESERKAGDEGPSCGFGVREGQPRERFAGEKSGAPQGQGLAPLQQVLWIQWPEQPTWAETHPKPLSSPSLSLGISAISLPFITPSFSLCLFRWSTTVTHFSVKSS